MQVMTMVHMLAFEWIDTETITEDNVAEKLAGCHGVIVPGGFGERGVEGYDFDSKILS